MSRSRERKLVTISGSKSKVERIEKKMSKTLSEGISVIMNLDDNQKAAVHRSIGNTESESGAVVNIPRRGEGDQVIISGTPEGVKSAESIITKLTTLPPLNHRPLLAHHFHPLLPPHLLPLLPPSACSAASDAVGCLHPSSLATAFKA